MQDIKKSTKENQVLNIDFPRDIRKLTLVQKTKLCKDIRKILVRTVSKCGGHLASNLGTVELTVALHSVFESPKDKLIWDVGHQSYTHKILTGRYDKFSTLRQEGGISGFTRPSESEHDAFIGGHSSNSISAACGLAAAGRLRGEKNHVVAVIGDGALTGGLAYEGLNNAGKSEDNIIIVLNHNDMSISKNVGALARHLTSIRTKQSYHKTKAIVKKTLELTPLFGKNLMNLMHNTKTALKNVVYHSNMFEDMGFAYLGPVDGHDLAELTEVLKIAKSLNRPVVVHTYTVKGKGYSYAEENPGAFHGISQFDVKTGNPDNECTDCFSARFGQALTELADCDENICAITAAMKYATGLDGFYRRHKSRFFDVGIAEQHAVTFAAGLAAGGMTPVFAVYSTFLQRAYDQLVHDCAIENYHMVIGVDRAGIVGDDGETHQGILDVSYLSTIPNVTILSPSNYSELRRSLIAAIYDYKGVVALRYPRGREFYSENGVSDYEFENMVYNQCYGADILLISYGRICANMEIAAQQLSHEGYSVSVLRLIHIHPILEKTLQIALKHTHVFFFEESEITGGIARQLFCELSARGYKGNYNITAITDGFVRQASVERTLAKYKLDSTSMVNTVKREMRKW